MNKITINNRRYRIKPRFYIICALILVVLVSTIIFLTSGTKGEVATFKEVTELPIVSVAKDILETSEPSKEIKPRYGFTDEDIYLFAQVVSGGETVDGDGEYDIDFQEEINYYEVS